MKYYLENYAICNDYDFSKAKAGFNFLYNEFLSSKKRVKWEEPVEEIIIQRSKYNNKLIIVSRKKKEPLFRIKTALDKDYVKYFFCFIKVNDKWFLQ